MRNEFSDLVVDNMKKSRKVEKNKLKVDDIEFFKRRNYVVQERDAGPSESEASGDRMSRYSSKSSVKSSIEDELPELVVFLQETNYEFVKDICIDEAVTSRQKCFKESCHTENDHVPCMLKYNAGETDAESTEESNDSDSTISSIESTQTLEENFNEVYEKQKVHSDAIDVPSEVPRKKSVPKLFLDRKVTGKKAASSTNSIAISLNKILDENRNKGKAVARSNIEHGKNFRNSGLSQSTIEGGSSNWTAGCGHCHDCTMAEYKDYTPENETGLYSSHCSSAVDLFGRIAAPTAHILLLFQFCQQNGMEVQKGWQKLIRCKHEGGNYGDYVCPAVISEPLIAQPFSALDSFRNVVEQAGGGLQLRTTISHHHVPSPNRKRDPVGTMNVEFLCEAFLEGRQ
ncbi:Retrovirus-related Pol polyprotein from transposon TNT 1-94 [Cucumis melo var. makuwa]|uniref:Retrovirus-related Pol polyprotein from transposon TNT 1-94 n=1 Tax=Cucumis melo var. makuwa TaxID=1194695 RepID=A0A5D3BGS8_CUCMM|nr:Retrovirus-related Pol polyprotein from transposon TNT 1-94 [Cucumis melo var. makuwa]